MRLALCVSASYYFIMINGLSTSSPAPQPSTTLHSLSYDDVNANVLFHFFSTVVTLFQESNLLRVPPSKEARGYLPGAHMQ